MHKVCYSGKSFCYKKNKNYKFLGSITKKSKNNNTAIYGIAQYYSALVTTSGYNFHAFRIITSKYAS